MIKIGIILLLIAAAGLAVAIIMAPANKVPTSRFEVLFPAATQDNVAITIRLIGSYHTDKYSGSGEFLKVFKETVRGEFGKVDQADIPKKVKLMFQKDIQALEIGGVKIDSIYQYEPDA